MSIVVFSPHTDDAIFSLGAHLAALTDVTIVSPMAAIPTDDAGRAKHERLHDEHDKACAVIGAAHIEGPFLDDAYPPSAPELVHQWLAGFLVPGVLAYIPLGIHHPDHLLISNLLIGMLDDNSPDGVLFYSELPYRVDYPRLAAERIARIEMLWPLCTVALPDSEPLVKAEAVLQYASQIDDNVLSRVLVDEFVWARINPMEAP